MPHLDILTYKTQGFYLGLTLLLTCSFAIVPLLTGRLFRFVLPTPVTSNSKVTFTVNI